jgi:hypothetical protein
VAKSHSAPSFEMVALYLTSDKGNYPVSGNSHYIVLDKSATRINLFHPFTFTKFSLSEPEFRMSLCNCEWTDHAAIANWLERMATSRAQQHRQGPYKLVREIIAHYRGCAASEVLDFHCPEEG